VPKDATISLTVYSDAIVPDAPSSPPTTPQPTVAVGANFSVNWTSYSCPSGTTLDSYSVQAVNAELLGEPGTTNSAALTATGTAGQTIEVKYNVTCSGSASGYSPAVTLTIQAAGPTNTPAPGDDD